MQHLCHLRQIDRYCPKTLTTVVASLRPWKTHTSVQYYIYMYIYIYVYIYMHTYTSFIVWSLDNLMTFNFAKFGWNCWMHKLTGWFWGPTFHRGMEDVVAVSGGGLGIETKERPRRRPRGFYMLFDHEKMAFWCFLVSCFFLSILWSTGKSCEL